MLLCGCFCVENMIEFFQMDQVTRSGKDRRQNSGMSWNHRINPEADAAKRSRRFARVLLAGIILLCMILPAAAGAEVSAAAYYKVETLKPAKTYKIDLNGGKKEKVRYKLKDKTDGRQTFKLYVNGKCVYKKTFSPLRQYARVASVKYLDIKRSDQYKELMLDLDGDQSNNGVMVLRYYSKNKIKVYESGKNEGLLDRTDSAGIQNTGKNKFFLNQDTPFPNETFGCYYARMPFKLKGSMIAKKNASKYRLMRVSDYTPGVFGTPYYVLARKMGLYETDSMNVVTRHCYAGTKFTPVWVKVIDEETVSYGSDPYTRYNLLVNVTLSTGESGWLYFPAFKQGDDYLTAVPAWG